MIDLTWYNSLIKPALLPKAAYFALAWKILYLMIVISLIFYIFKEKENKGKGYLYFILQIIFNLSWQGIFFGLKNIGFALFIIILIDLFAFLTIKEFYKTSKVAAFLLIPYFFWLLFATYLNISFFLLN